jgi:hypothetical protein
MRAVCSYIKNPNIRETDSISGVEHEHVVELSNGAHVSIFAEAPDDAIRKVNHDIRAFNLEQHPEKLAGYFIVIKEASDAELE